MIGSHRSSSTKHYSALPAQTRTRTLQAPNFISVFTTRAGRSPPQAPTVSVRRQYLTRKRPRVVIGVNGLVAFSPPAHPAHSRRSSSHTSMTRFQAHAFISASFFASYFVHHHREAAPKFEHFDRFGEGARAGGGGGGDDGSSVTPGANSPATSPRATGSAAAPGAKANSTLNRTHPHFFHGLGPNARKLFMELYAENRSRLLAPISRNTINSSIAPPTASSRQSHLPEQTSSAAPPDGSSLPNLALSASGSQQPPRQLPQQASPRAVAGPSSVGTGNGCAAANVRHAAGAFAAAGPPPDLDATIMDRYEVLLVRLTEAAIRIQRARRLGGMPRAARRLRRHQRAALAVQRVFRGHLGRRCVVCCRSKLLHAELLIIGKKSL